MKPSERIQEIYDVMRNRGIVSTDALLNAVINHLDEEYEKNQTKSIPEMISDLNSKGICIRGGNFGCACPGCLKEMREILAK